MTIRLPIKLKIYIKYIAFIQEYGIKVNKIITLRYVKYGILPGKIDIKKTVTCFYIKQQIQSNNLSIFTNCTPITSLPASLFVLS